MIFSPSTMNEYMYSSGASGSGVVYSHTPSLPSLRSATPGASQMPLSVSMGMAFRKSPVTCTFTALGAFRRKVTVLSSWISGETTGAPPHKACCAKVTADISKSADKKNSFFIRMFLMVLKMILCFPADVLRVRFPVRNVTKIFPHSPPPYLQNTCRELQKCCLKLQKKLFPLLFRGGKTAETKRYCAKMVAILRQDGSDTTPGR